LIKPEHATHICLSELDVQYDEEFRVYRKTVVVSTEANGWVNNGAKGKFSKIGESRPRCSYDSALAHAPQLYISKSVLIYLCYVTSSKKYSIEYQYEVIVYAP